MITIAENLKALNFLVEINELIHSIQTLCFFLTSAIRQTKAKMKKRRKNLSKFNVMTFYKLL